MTIPAQALVRFYRSAHAMLRCLDQPEKALYWSHRHTIHANQAYQIIARTLARNDKPAAKNRSPNHRKGV